MEGAVKLRCHSGKDEPRSWFLCDVEFVLTGLHNVQYLSLPRYDNYHYITIGPMLGLPWSIERVWPFTYRGRILNFREHTSRCSDSPWYTKLYRSVEFGANSHSDTRRRRTLKEEQQRYDPMTPNTRALSGSYQSFISIRGSHWAISYSQGQLPNFPRWYAMKLI